MTNEHHGQSIYENGRFRLREETDYAIIDELGEFPPIMVQHIVETNGFESCYADRISVLHLLNELADTNPNEQKHFYLKYRLDKVHGENAVLRKRVQELETKLNETAFELLDNEIISMGKAVEISEKSYHDFLGYRAEKGNPMELQL